MGTQYPIEFFLKDTIHLCICSFTDLSLLLFARVYSVTGLLWPLQIVTVWTAAVCIGK